MILELFIELKLTMQVYNSQEGSVRCEDDTSSHLENVKLFVRPSQCMYKASCIKDDKTRITHFVENHLVKNP